MTKLAWNAKRKWKKTGDTTAAVRAPMIVTSRIMTDTTLPTLTRITATIHHITLTIPTIEIMDIGDLILMVESIGAITLPATTRIATSITARDAHGIIEALILGVQSPTDLFGKRIVNRIKPPRKRIIQGVEKREVIKGGAK